MIASDSADRVIACDGIHNFRDYGGYASGWGGSVTSGRLFRSAQHAGASDADMARVGAIGFAAVIDLRGPRERRAAPCPRPAGFAATVILDDDEAAPVDAPHILAAAHIRTAADAEAAMTRIYRTRPFEAGMMRLYARYFATLAATDGPTLIHCYAGKDRTGVAVALLQRMLRVHPDDVMADYLLTNTAGDAEARIASAAVAMRAYYGEHLSDEAIRAIMACRPDYLEAAWAEMKARHGGVEGYIAALGVTAQDEGLLRDRLIR